MKMKRETRAALGLSAVFSALVLSVAFIVLAIRKRSIIGALLAVLSAMAGAAGTGAFLAALFAPDPDGEQALAPLQDVGAEEAELFAAEELAGARRYLKDIL